MSKLKEAALNFLPKWWAAVIIPTVGLAYMLFNDWKANQEVFEITGLERLALYDLRHEHDVAAPNYAALFVLEITNKGRKPIYIAKADCLVDRRAAMIFSIRDVRCAAFAGRPRDDYSSFVRDGLKNPTISNFGRKASVAPSALEAGAVGYVTLLFLHNPKLPMPEGKMLRIGGFEPIHWDDEGVKDGAPFLHQVVVIDSLDWLYDSEPFDTFKIEVFESFVGADLQLETTKGTRLDPISIASLVFSEAATDMVNRFEFPFFYERAEKN